MKKKKERSHFARIENSDRLKLLLRALRETWCCKKTTAYLKAETGSVAVHSDIHELRKNGYKIECKYSHTNTDDRKIYVYRLIG